MRYAAAARSSSAPTGCRLYIPGPAAGRPPPVHRSHGGALDGAAPRGRRVSDLRGGADIVDVGGGSGALLAAILEANPAASGIVLDLPAATAVARRRLAAAGLSRRGRVMVGDFFRRVPPGGDVYVLAFVLHNWDDRRALTILRNCRATMSDGARLVIIEVIVPRSARPSPARIHDLEMLVFTPGGRERTAAEYRTLLSAAGLRVRRTVTTGTPVSFIEAAPSPVRRSGRTSGSSPSAGPRRRRPAHPRPRRDAN